jgi:hypothetical protein
VFFFSFHIITFFDEAKAVLGIHLPKQLSIVDRADEMLKVPFSFLLSFSLDTSVLSDSTRPCLGLNGRSLLVSGSRGSAC